MCGILCLQVHQQQPQQQHRQWYLQRLHLPLLFPLWACLRHLVPPGTCHHLLEDTTHQLCLCRHPGHCHLVSLLLWVRLFLWVPELQSSLLPSSLIQGRALHTLQVVPSSVLLYWRCCFGIWGLLPLLGW